MTIMEEIRDYLKSEGYEILGYFPMFLSAKCETFYVRADYIFDEYRRKQFINIDVTCERDDPEEVLVSKGFVEEPMKLKTLNRIKKFIHAANKFIIDMEEE